MNAVLNKIAKGVTVCYSEVFPHSNKEYFHYNYAGKLFLIADSYCMNPDCTCQEAVLNFVQVYPREGRKAESFIIGYKLNGSKYKIHEQGNFNRRDIKAMAQRFTMDGAILKQLNERFKEMKEKAKEMLSYK